MPEKEEGKKPAGPQILQKSPNAAKKDEPPPEQKGEFTQLRPPGAESPVDKAAQGGAAIHQAQAAAARAEDRAGQPPEDGEGDEEEGDKKLDDMVERFVTQFQPDDQLMTPEQRELVEKRLEPIDLTQMFTEQEFRQVVPIILDQFVIEYRSISGAEDEELKLMLSNEPENVSPRYISDKYASLSLICSVRRINNKELPVHYTPQKGWDKKKFEEKGMLIMAMPAPAVWSMMVHASWFDRRCKELFKVSEVKNG